MILDTNAVSALAASLSQAEELVLPVIVLGEYRYGINQSRHRLRYQQWLAELISVSRILDVDLVNPAPIRRSGRFSPDIDHRLAGQKVFKQDGATRAVNAGKAADKPAGR